MQELDEALTLLRRALELIDACEDPHEVGPHLDLAIARLELRAEESPTNDNFDDRRDRLIN
jgi:exonuclease VII small subunit